MQRFGIAVLTGMMTVTMVQVDANLKVFCGNVKPDDQTRFNRDLLWRTHYTWWGNSYRKIMNFIFNPGKFEPGDAIYCWMPNSGLAKHYALYKGDNLIMHVQNSTIVMSLVENWKQVGCDGPYVLADYYNVDGLKAVRRAEHMMGRRVCYDVNTCNGEHFVAYWMERSLCDNQSDRCPNYHCLGHYSKEDIEALYG